ncbi:putative UDP-Glycosyltransferase superfamily protein [Hibiscus syriacus]|uniref:UDP-Glycosyltransferase superfamily protein n=1 Tax=Hibiscus syriacus TaxID=106335 RepID=A0A6A3B8F5_HIBSY|nr:putative UDP-Glycosyltransferase superfamily protein [Hibiscus syriacus]
MSKEQLIELWYGLVNGKSKFFLVVRPDSVIGKDGEGEDVDVVKELFDKTKDRGYIVDWAPQEAVLNHPAVGVNSRIVSEVWRIGLDMKDVCDRKIVEVMVDRKDEFAKSAAELAKLTIQSVSSAGSSYSNLDRLIEDISEMSLKTPQKLIVS